MFEFFKSLVDLAGDERRTLSAKASIALLLIIAVIVGEGLFGFAHHYQVEKQLQELKMLDEILPDSVLWRTHEEEIRRLANELLSYKPWTERLLDLNRPWQDDAPIAIGRWPSVRSIFGSVHAMPAHPSRYARPESSRSASAHSRYRSGRSDQITCLPNVRQDQSRRPRRPHRAR